MEISDAVVVGVAISSFPSFFSISICTQQIVWLHLCVRVLSLRCHDQKDCLTVLCLAWFVLHSRFNNKHSAGLCTCIRVCFCPGGEDSDGGGTAHIGSCEADGGDLGE